MITKLLPALGVVGAVTMGIAAATVPATAQSVASADAAAVRAGRYDVEPGHTQVGFTVSHFGFTGFSGLFGSASGQLQLDPSDPARSSLNVSIPVTGVLTTSAKLDDELKGAQWFDAARFPEASFTSTKITETGNGQATVAGRLTLHGVTHPLTLQVHFVGAGVNPLDKHYTIGFEASGTIRRSDFGVKTYVPLVGDDVRLSIAGAFEQAS